MNDMCTIQWLSNGIWYDHMTMPYDSWSTRAQMESLANMVGHDKRIRCVDSRGRLMDSL